MSGLIVEDFGVGYDKDSIMHYGADYTLGRAYFNKMNYQQLRLEECSRHLLDTS